MLFVRSAATPLTGKNNHVHELEMNAQRTHADFSYLWYYSPLGTGRI
jgi:hypothetical protein